MLRTLLSNNFLTLAQVRGLSVDMPIPVFIIEKGKIYRPDISDTTSLDNGFSVIVTGNGVRMKPVPIEGVFAGDTDSNTREIKTGDFTTMNLKTGTYTVRDAVTGMPYSSTWLVGVKHLDFDFTGGTTWRVLEATDVNTSGRVFVSTYRDGIGFQPWSRMHNNDWFAVAAMTPVAGDLFYHDGTTWTRLAKGNTGQVLTQGAVAPSWSAVGGTNTTVTADTQLVANSTVITNSASRLNLTLPADANWNVGDKIFVRGRGAGGWKILQNASQVIHGNTNTTVGTGGSIASGAQYDTITIEKIATNEATVTSGRGTFTIV